MGKILNLKALQLNPRDRIAVLAAGAVIAVFILVQFVIFPTFDSRQRLQRQYQARQKALVQINDMQRQYTELNRKARRGTDQLKRRAKNFTLFSFLDTLARQNGIKDNIVFMKPSTATPKNSPYRLSIVEMKLADLTMGQLIRFLYGVETSANAIRVKRLSITKNKKNKALLSAILQVQTFQV